MAFELFTRSGVFLTNIEKILTCTKKETLSGVLTLNFETLITDELETLVNGSDYTILYNNEYYDVVSIQKSLSKGLYKIKFSCEHVSYRLSGFSRSYFWGIGTVKEILTLLLKDTGFYAGISDITADFEIPIKEESTVRSMILKIANIIGCDVEFTGFYVNMFSHRGSSNPIDLIDKNVVSISKTEKAGLLVPTYSITVRPTTNLVVGDELHLKFDRLGINENVRLIGITSKPFISKDYDLEVGVAEATIEADLVSLKQDSIESNKSYYGVKISPDDGLTVVREDQKAKVIMNSDEFRMQAMDEDYIFRDRLYFDPIAGSYKFSGSIEVDAGKININNKFIVDENGDVHMSGQSTIYGGRYYAGDIENSDGYSQMTSSGFEVFNSTNDIKLRLGYTTEGEDYPYIQLGSGSGAFTDFGLVKKFTDGLWIGNSEPADESGNFTPMLGYNGIFFRFSDNTAYVVKDTEMKNIYTGAAIAKFG